MKAPFTSGTNFVVPSERSKRNTQLALCMQQALPAHAALIRAQLMHENRQLVFALVKTWGWATVPSAGYDPIVSFDDLVAAGNLGLLQAIDRFDPTKGTLATWASVWIMLEMRNLIAARGVAHVPRNMIPLVTKFKSLKPRAEMLGWTEKEWAIALGIEPARFSDVLAARNGMRPPSFSFDVLTEDGGEILNRDQLEFAFRSRSSDEGSQNIAEANLLQEDHYKILASLLEGLSDRQRDMLERRFGLNGKTPHSFEDIGDLYNLSRQRVQQIEEETFVFLRRRALELGIKDMSSLFLDQ